MTQPTVRVRSSYSRRSDVFNRSPQHHLKLGLGERRFEQVASIRVIFADDRDAPVGVV